jgi:hypothetical protein
MTTVRFLWLKTSLRLAALVTVSGLLGTSLPGCSGGMGASSPKMTAGPDGIYHVRPGESIQEALNAAADDPRHKTVRVHAGVYRPQQPGQAFVWMNHHHDGVTLEAAGEVILTAANPAIADLAAESYPAVVNHVVYLGDGVSARTVVRGFKITGANHFVTEADEPGPIQPETGLPTLRKSLFFLADGGAIKIFGRSYPTIENVEIYDNYANPCGGGISVEHCGFDQQAVTLRNCIFRDNRSQVTGSAVDVLPGSAAVIENCLFVGNISNSGPDTVGTPDGPYNGKHGSGALTVFPDSRVEVTRSTFTGNWNGADDKGTGNVYQGCIFWKNTRSGGICPGDRYELDILDARNVTGCFFHGTINDLRGSIDSTRNTMNAPDPRFDPQYRPQAAEYAEAGYRPVNQ